MPSIPMTISSNEKETSSSLARTVRRTLEQPWLAAGTVWLGEPNSSGPVRVELDSKLTITACNHQASILLMRDLIGVRFIDDLVSPKGRVTIRKMISEAFKGSSITNVGLLLKSSDKLVPLIVDILPGTASSVIVIESDPLDTQSLTESFHGAVAWLTSNSGKVLASSQLGIELMGYSEAFNMIGKSLVGDLADPPNRTHIRELLQQVLIGDDALRSADIQMRTCDESLLQLQVDLLPVSQWHAETDLGAVHGVIPVENWPGSGVLWINWQGNIPIVGEEARAQYLSNSDPDQDSQDVVELAIESVWSTIDTVSSTLVNSSTSSSVGQQGTHKWFKSIDKTISPQLLAIDEKASLITKAENDANLAAMQSSSAADTVATSLAAVREPNLARVVANLSHKIIAGELSSSELRDGCNQMQQLIPLLRDKGETSQIADIELLVSELERAATLQAEVERMQDTSAKEENWFADLQLGKVESEVEDNQPGPAEVHNMPPATDEEMAALNRELDEAARRFEEMENEQKTQPGNDDALRKELDEMDGVGYSTIVSAPSVDVEVHSLVDVEVQSPSVDVEVQSPSMDVEVQSPSVDVEVQSPSVNVEVQSPSVHKEVQSPSVDVESPTSLQVSPARLSSRPTPQPSPGLYRSRFLDFRSPSPAVAMPADGFLMRSGSLAEIGNSIEADKEMEDLLESIKVVVVGDAAVGKVCCALYQQCMPKSCAVQSCLLDTLTGNCAVEWDNPSCN